MASILVTAGILAAGILTGGMSERQAPEIPREHQNGWMLERTLGGGEAEVRGKRGEFILKTDMLPEADITHHALVLRGKATGERVTIAEGVTGARKSPAGRLFFVQGDDLFRLEDGGEPRKLISDQKSSADFEFDVNAPRLAMVRLSDKTGDRSAIDLFSEDGRLIRRLVNMQDALLWLPVFTPDGSALIFLSSEGGFASFWRVELDGRGLRQLTNRQVRRETGGVFQQDFVPPADSREGMKFVSNSVLEYRANGTEIWQINVESGRARRVLADTGASGEENCGEEGEP